MVKKYEKVGLDQGMTWGMLIFPLSSSFIGIIEMIYK